MNAIDFLQSLWERVQEYRRRQANYRALLMMSPRQLRDIGLSPEDVTAIVHGYVPSGTREQRLQVPRPSTTRERPGVQTALAAGRTAGNQAS